MKEYNLFQSGLSYKEIAEKTNQSPGLVFSKIYAYRMLLKRERLRLFKSINKNK